MYMAMYRTTIMIPPDLKMRAGRRAHKLGVSLGELIREALVVMLDRPVAKHSKDSLLDDKAVFKGKAPSDLSTHHDHYLYEE